MNKRTAVTVVLAQGAVLSLTYALTTDFAKLVETGQINKCDTLAAQVRHAQA